MRVLRRARDHAQAREAASQALARSWHEGVMYALYTPRPEAVGCFRGEKPLLRCYVQIGKASGTPPGDVGQKLGVFFETLERLLNVYDAKIPVGKSPPGELLEEILGIMSWVHGEWVQIHPFANGNGRTARLWANWVAMRYGLPPFVRLRPRPDGRHYARAAAAAMSPGGWKEMIGIFDAMLTQVLVEASP